MANFHVDSSGNLWIGTNSSNTFSTAQSANVPFSVTSAGAIKATSGELENLTVTNPVITLATNSDTGAPSGASSSVLKIGTSTLFERSNKLFSSKPFVVYPDGDEDNPSLTISGDYDEMGFFVSNSTEIGGYSTFSASNGDDDIWSFNTLSSQFNIKGTLSLEGPLSATGGSGNSGQVLTSTGTNTKPEWTTTSGHTHNATVLMTTDIGNNVSGDHNHPYGSGNGNSNWGSSDTDNNSKVSTAYSHSQSAHSNHNHTGTVLTTAGADNLYASAHNHPYASSNHGNSAHNVDYAAESYVNGQITSHLFSASHSDERIKENVSDIVLGLDFIKNLKPRDFTWKESYLDSEYSDDNTSESKYKTLISNTQQGFVAQEVKTAVFETTGGNTAFGGLRIGDITDGDKTLSSDSDDFGRVDYVQIIAPLVKAVQELSAKIDVLDARIDELEGA